MVFTKLWHQQLLLAAAGERVTARLDAAAACLESVHERAFLYVLPFRREA